MMNNNKILTVSYGTFSCTLEGFDDSFDTMKAIAEYFRDLAADDRYFGAEPPQPDADMLAKIAEREVARRVEASEHDGRIMLKAHDDTPELRPTAPIAAPVTETIEPEETFTTEPDPVIESAPEALVTQADTDQEEATSEDEIDESSAAAFFANSPTVEDLPEENEGLEEISVEAFTGYIAAGAAETADAEASDDAGIHEDEDDFAVDETEGHDIAEYADDGSDGASETPETLEETSEEKDMAEEQDDLSADDISEDPEDLILEQEEPASNTIFAAESFAEKLQRIRDVVSRHDGNEGDEDYEEDLDVASETEGASVPSFDQDPDETAGNPILAEAAQDIETALMQEDDESADDIEAESDDLDEILGRIEADAEEEIEFQESAIASTDNDNIFGEETDEDDENTESVSVDGRILKVNRSALDAALESGELEEYDDTDEQPDAAQEFSEEQDQELHSNLAALKKLTEEEEVQKPSTARESLPEIDETGNGVSRLMAEADQQMDEPEGKTRRSAFAHLRAAVAARFADRSMDKDVQEEEEKEAEVYRSDLAEVVKPRRPDSSAEEDNRAHASRPSPLKLVAEQRIDPEDKGGNDHVSPRRVSASVSEDLILEEDTDFAGYAEDRGAHTLAEVLEAAAAYLCHIEGVEEFSRPQLMSRVKQADCGDFTREDGLRAFGQLLRTGKIEKIKGGRFVASEAIGFKPGHREAG